VRVVKQGDWWVATLVGKPGSRYELCPSSASEDKAWEVAETLAAHLVMGGSASDAVTVRSITWNRIKNLSDRSVLAPS
jgi:hypothetical protein